MPCGSGRLPPALSAREVSTQRLQKLEHPALSIADDAPTPFETVRSNPLGTKKGYDPYDSGKLGKKPRAGEEGSAQAERVAEAEKAGRRQQGRRSNRSLSGHAKRVTQFCRVLRDDRNCAVRAPAPRFAPHPCSRNAVPTAGNNAPRSGAPFDSAHIGRAPGAHRSSRDRTAAHAPVRGSAPPC